MERTLEGRIGDFLEEYLILDGVNDENIEYSLMDAVKEIEWNLKECQSNKAELAYLERLKTATRKTDKWLRIHQANKYKHKKKFITRFVSHINKLIGRIPKSQITDRFVWKGKAAHLGFLIAELKRKGFIDYPTTNGEESFNKAAKVLLNLFELETSHGNLAKEVNYEEGKGTLSNVLRHKFLIPELSEL